METAWLTTKIVHARKRVETGSWALTARKKAINPRTMQSQVSRLRPPVAASRPGDRNAVNPLITESPRSLALTSRRVGRRPARAATSRRVRSGYVTMR